jgi:hypothetical protein
MSGWKSLGLFGLSLMSLGSKHSRLWNVSFLHNSCIIVKCCSFRVLTKALFLGAKAPLEPAYVSNCVCMSRKSFKNKV